MLVHASCCLLHPWFTGSVWDSPGLKHSHFFSLHISSAASQTNSASSSPARWCSLTPSCSFYTCNRCFHLEQFIIPMFEGKHLWCCVFVEWNLSHSVTFYSAFTYPKYICVLIFLTCMLLTNYLMLLLIICSYYLFCNVCFCADFYVHKLNAMPQTVIWSF